MNPFRAAIASAQSLWDAFWSRRGYEVLGTRTTTSGEPVNEDIALTYSAVWAATRLLCGTGAWLPLPLYRGLSDEHERTKEREHPLYRILNGNPNPEMTAYNFRSVMWKAQVNGGNAFAEVVREGNDPEGPLLALYPLDPCLVTMRRDENGDLYYEVRDDQTGQPNDLPRWKVFHVPSVLTADGFMGMGVIAHARESIGSAIAAEKYGANSFGSGAMPKVVVEHPGDWKQQQREAFRKEWDEIHGRPDGHRVALLMGGAKANALSLSAVDSQYLESRQFSVEEIARWYGVPPHLLQHLLRATFNNIEHLGINFVQYTLIPWLRIWEQCIWHQLLTEDERGELFVEHNVTALLRGDSAARAAYYREMWAVSAMTRNEIRKMENLPPVEGGDTFLVQGAMVPLDDDGKPVSEFAQSSVTPATTTMRRPTEPEEPEEPENESKIDENAVISSLNHVIQHDLSRFLTKETQAMATYSKKPKEFLTRVEEFYIKQTTQLRDEVTYTFGALQSCGVGVDPDSFVTKWVSEGKKMVVEASGAATPDRLFDVIDGVMQSKAWSERPIRAVEGVKHATAVV